MTENEETEQAGVSGAAESSQQKPGIARICFCGASLVETTLDDEKCYGKNWDSYLPCDYCGKDLREEKSIFHCVQEDVEQHWIPHDYCQECAAIPNKHPKSICLCGNHLIKTHPNHPRCYGKSPVTVHCDNCGDDISKQPIFYHCSNDKSSKHPNSIDYCIACAFGQKRRFTKKEVRKHKHIQCPVCNSEMSESTIKDAYDDISFVCSMEGCSRIVGRCDMGYVCNNADREKQGVRCGYLYLYCIPCLYANTREIENYERKIIQNESQEKGWPFFARYNHRPNLECKKRFPNPTKEDPIYPNLFGSKLPTPKRHWYYKPSKRNTKRIVFIDGKIKHITDIKIAEETFFVKFHIFYNWLASYEEVEKYMKDKQNYKPPVPGVVIDNLKEFGMSGDAPKPGKPSLRAGYSVITKTAVEGHGGIDWKQDSEFGIADENCIAWDLSPNTFGFDPRFAYFWRCKVDYTCTLVEELELPFFPFDVQDFTIHLRAKKPIHSMDLLPYPRIGFYLSLAADYSVLAEWNVKHLLAEFVRKGEEQSKTANGYATVGIHIKAERNPETFKFHFLVLCAMAWLGLCTFAVNAKEDLGVRLGYSITLLLADVATQQLIEENMPNIPYTTFLDTYMYGCFMFLVAVNVWSSIATLLHQYYDLCALAASAIILSIGHIYIIRKFFKERRLEREKFFMCDEELHEHFQSHAKDAVTDIPNCMIRWSAERKGGHSHTLVCLSEPERISERLLQQQKAQRPLIPYKVEKAVHTHHHHHQLQPEELGDLHKPLLFSDNSAPTN